MLSPTGGTSFNHISGAGGTPAIVAGTGAGTAPTASISGTDFGGTISVTVGTTPAATATFATITFAVAFSTAPRCVNFSPQNSTAIIGQQGAKAIYVSSITSTGFILTTSTNAPTGSVLLTYTYIVVA